MGLLARAVRYNNLMLIYKTLEEDADNLHPPGYEPVNGIPLHPITIRTKMPIIMEAESDK